MNWKLIKLNPPSIKFKHFRLKKQSNSKIQTETLPVVEVLHIQWATVWFKIFLLSFSTFVFRETSSSICSVELFIKIPHWLKYSSPSCITRMIFVGDRAVGAWSQLRPKASCVRYPGKQAQRQSKYLDLSCLEEQKKTETILSRCRSARPCQEGVRKSLWIGFQVHQYLRVMREVAR